MSYRATSPFDPRYKDAFHEPLLTAGLLLHVAGREFTDLDGQWQFHIDPYDSFRRRCSLAPRYAQLLGTDDETALRSVHADFPAGAWETIDVPSCWNDARPALEHYEGVALFLRRFDRPSLAGPHYLCVGAANYETSVWLNGEFIGRHVGGFTPFGAHVTSLLAERNVLVLVVDNRRERNRVPALQYDWFNYGGVFRSVRIVPLPEAHIKRTFVCLVPGTSYRRVRLDVETSAAAGERVDLKMPELSLSECALIDESGRATIEFDAQLDLWSPGSPKLYDAEVSLESGDRVEEAIGFREVRTEGNRLLLNGVPIFLRGVCSHEEVPGRGRSLRSEDTDDLLASARELGCNFIRLAHYPHREDIPRACDREGFVLWEEIPVYWAIAFDDPVALADARNQLEELIVRDRNRASVIFWSVANETPSSAERDEFVSALARAAHELDPTRLVTAAMLPQADDVLLCELDVIGINEYFGWYYGAPEDMKELLDDVSLVGKPIIVSEFGADAVAGRRGAPDEIRTEDFQSDFYRRQFDCIREAASVVGTTPWVLYDFRSPLRQNVYEAGYNRKGLIADDHRTKKLAFQTVRDVYEEIAASRS